MKHRIDITILKGQGVKYKDGVIRFNHRLGFGVAKCAFQRILIRRLKIN